MNRNHQTVTVTKLVSLIGNVRRNMLTSTVTTSRNGHRNRSTPHVTSKGFTIIELLIYMGIFSIVLFVTLDFFFLSQVVKGEVVQHQEVDRNARAALLEMTQTIREAANVSAPLLGLTGSSLSLNTGAISYTLNGGLLQKTEGGQTHNLTADSVTIEDISFTSRGEAGEMPTVSIAFTIRTNTRIFGKPDYITKTFQTTVQLR